jgi:hypothetical protein
MKELISFRAVGPKFAFRSSIGWAVNCFNFRAKVIRCNKAGRLHDARSHIGIVQNSDLVINLHDLFEGVIAVGL